MTEALRVATMQCNRSEMPAFMAISSHAMTLSLLEPHAHQFDLFSIYLCVQEVLMMLDNYVRDFKALIDWIQLQEKLENTDAENR